MNINPYPHNIENTKGLCNRHCTNTYREFRTCKENIAIILLIYLVKQKLNPAVNQGCSFK